MWWKVEDYYKDKEKKRKPRYYLLIIPIVLITFIVYLNLIRPELKPVVDCDVSYVSPSALDVQLSEKSKVYYDLEYAKSPTQHELGLSQRPCLPKDAALLFLYAQDDKFGIWMKEMRFPIDVIWLDKDKKIVKIEKNMQPDSYPKVYRPRVDARYVLEMNVGGVDELQVSEGSTLSW